MKWIDSQIIEYKDKAKLFGVKTDDNNGGGGDNKNISNPPEHETTGDKDLMDPENNDFIAWENPKK